MSYKKIEIENFRGIKKLIIDNIKNINVFVGKNNSSKSTILEGMFILTGINNPQLPLMINSFREFNLEITSVEDSLKYIFRNLDFKNTIKLSGESSNRNLRTMSIFPTQSNIQPTTNLNVDGAVLSTDTKGSQGYNGLNIDFYINGKKYTSSMHITGPNIDLKGAQFQNTLSGVLVTQNKILHGTVQRLESIIINKDLNLLVEAVKHIDHRVSDIRIGSKNIIYVDIGLNSLIPLNMMGDGVRRLVSILTTIYDPKINTIFLDEIENGFHYSILPTLWNTIIPFIKKFNKQIFITTHSYECIQAFSKEATENCNLYKIISKGDTHKVTMLTNDELENGLKMDIEVR